MTAPRAPDAPPYAAPLGAEFARLAGLLDPEAAGSRHRRRGGANRAPRPIDRLCGSFGLNAFERDVVLLCAGVELDADLAAAVGRHAALAAGAAPEPTFALALTVLPDADWYALLPSAPLRHWRLIEVAPGPRLTARPLRIDERILHHIQGMDYIDERLAGVVEIPGEIEEIGPAHAAVARQMVAAWEAASAAGARLPVLQLCGDDPAIGLAVAAEACRLLDRVPMQVHAHVLPGPAELGPFQRLCEREATLHGGLLLLRADAVAGEGGAGAEAFIDRASGPLVVVRPRRGPPRERPLVTFDLCRSGIDELTELWARVLGDAADAAAPCIPALAHQFDLRISAIRTAAIEAAGAVEAGQPLASALWDSCREQARPRLDEVVQRIAPRTGWDDLVLPEAQTATLRMIADQIRHRPTVHGAWGFTGTGDRGFGLAVLFAGPSGTGKTLAAEVLAGELRLDLYRIDLSAVVDKYIGETEKNLRRAFEAAEAGGAILLFDEADALFGKRSDVKDSHDRHANVEVGYLLQRVEAYRGLAVLTTNLKENLDQAFLRRLRFVVQFPFPGPAERRRIWIRAFPRENLRTELDFDRLAQLNLPGGGIRNIALNAAFLAAAQGGPVTMAQIGEAARREYAKLDRTLTEAETRGWS